MSLILLLALAAPAPPERTPAPPPPPDLEPLAARLLSMDPPPAALPLPSDGLLTAVRRVALRWEILDERERRYILVCNQDFQYDVKLLHRRYLELADAPPLYDCMRFPDRNLVNDLLTFNRAYKAHLEGRQEIELCNAWQLRQMILETDALYAAYDLVRDAKADYYYVTVRRQALKKLKALIGDQAFYSGQLPPHVPVWRFTRIDD